MSDHLDGGGVTSVNVLVVDDVESALNVLVSKLRYLGFQDSFRPADTPVRALAELRDYHLGGVAIGILVLDVDLGLEGQDNEDAASVIGFFAKRLNPGTQVLWHTNHPRGSSRPEGVDGFARKGTPEFGSVYSRLRNVVLSHPDSHLFCNRPEQQPLVRGSRAISWLKSDVAHRLRSPWTALFYTLEAFERGNDDAFVIEAGKQDWYSWLGRSLDDLAKHTDDLFRSPRRSGVWLNGRPLAEAAVVQSSWNEMIAFTVDPHLRALIETLSDASLDRRRRDSQSYRSFVSGHRNDPARMGDMRAVTEAINRLCGAVDSVLSLPIEGYGGE